MRVIVGSPDPNFDPIILDISKDNGFLTKEYYDKDDEDLPKLFCEYAYYIIDGRWSVVESIIMKNPGYAHLYAYNLVGGRWPEAEPIIMKDPRSAYLYARNVISSRWPEAEENIKQDKFWWKAYCEFCGIEE